MSTATRQAAGISERYSLALPPNFFKAAVALITGVPFEILVQCMIVDDLSMRSSMTWLVVAGAL
jgi:hypothetical protein